MRDEVLYIYFIEIPLGFYFCIFSGFVDPDDIGISPHRIIDLLESPARTLVSVIAEVDEFHSFVHIMWFVSLEYIDTRLHSCHGLEQVCRHLDAGDESMFFEDELIGFYGFS